MKANRILISLLTIYFAQPGVERCFAAETKPGRFAGIKEARQGKRHMVEQPKIRTPYDDVDVAELPKIIPLTDEQRSYVIEILAAAKRVIEGITPLEAEEQKIFGSGQYFWPKDPTKPIKTLKFYPSGNFRMPGISLAVQRRNETAEWSKVGLTLEPRNFPAGAFSMNLPPDTFTDFALTKITQESRPDESVARPVVFYFSHRKLPGLTMEIESRDDLASVKDRYPASFHVIRLLRRSPD